MSLYLSAFIQRIIEVSTWLLHVVHKVCKDNVDNLSMSGMIRRGASGYQGPSRVYRRHHV